MACRYAAAPASGFAPDLPEHAFEGVVRVGDAAKLPHEEMALPHTKKEVFRRTALLTCYSQ